MGNLKLYVYKNVLSDYTPGVAFALAESEEQAHNLILGTEDAKSGHHRHTWAEHHTEKGFKRTYTRNLKNFYEPETARRPVECYCEFLDPEVHEEPYGFAIYGGG